MQQSRIKQNKESYIITALCKRVKNSENCYSDVETFYLKEWMFSTPEFLNYLVAWDYQRTTLRTGITFKKITL